MNGRSCSIPILLGVALMGAACTDSLVPSPATADSAQLLGLPPLPPIIPVPSVTERYVVVLKSSAPDPVGLAPTLVAALGGTLHFTYATALRGFAASLPSAAVVLLRADPRWALADDTPLRGHMPVARVSIPGQPESTIAQPIGLNRNAIALLRMPLRAGRWALDDASHNEAVVSQSLAQALWGTSEVVGRTFTANQSPFAEDAEFTVVGTMSDVRMQDTMARPAFVTALRAVPRTEGVGMDVSQHGEEAYASGEGSILVPPETAILSETVTALTPQVASH